MAAEVSSGAPTGIVVDPAFTLDGRAYSGRRFVVRIIKPLGRDGAWLIGIQGRVARAVAEASVHRGDVVLVSATYRDGRLLLRVHEHVRRGNEGDSAHALPRNMLPRDAFEYARDLLLRNQITLQQRQLHHIRRECMRRGASARQQYMHTLRGLCERGIIPDEIDMVGAFSERQFGRHRERRGSSGKRDANSSPNSNADKQRQGGVESEDALSSLDALNLLVNHIMPRGAYRERWMLIPFAIDSIPVEGRMHIKYERVSGRCAQAIVYILYNECEWQIDAHRLRTGAWEARIACSRAGYERALSTGIDALRDGLKQWGVESVVCVEGGIDDAIWHDDYTPPVDVHV